MGARVRRVRGTSRTSRRSWRVAAAIVLAAASIGPVAAALPAPAASAAPGPWDTDDFYWIAATGNTVWERSPDGTVTSHPVTAPITLSQLALSPTGEMYATGVSDRNLYRIDADGTAVSLGVPTGMPYLLGSIAFDPDGRLWGMTAGGQNAVPHSIYQIDVQELAVVQTFTYPSTYVPLSDLAWVDGDLYARGSFAPGYLVRIDPVTQAVSRVALPGSLAGTAAWSTPGHLYIGFGTTMQEVLGYDTDTPRVVAVTTTLAAGAYADGASSPTAPNPFLDAADDAFSTVPAATASTVGNVYANDTMNGAAVTPAAVTATVTDDDGTGATIAADGTLAVPATITAGTYAVSYRICQTANVGICDPATVTFTVLNIVAAEDDAFTTPVPRTGGTVGNVLDNDTINGQPIDPTTVTVTVTDDAGTGATIGADGTLTAPAGIAAGSYTVTYEVCEVDDVDSCSTATATFTVLQNAIEAVDDDFTATPVPATGGDAGNVLDNDTIDGQPVDPTTVTVTVSDDAGTGATIAADGALTIPAGVAPGTYTVTYEVCELSDVDNCSTATATVVVAAADGQNPPTQEPTPSAPAPSAPTPSAPATADDGTGLPRTGAAVAGWLAAAAALLIGAGLVAARRRTIS